MASTTKGTRLHRRQPDSNGPFPDYDLTVTTTPSEIAPDSPINSPEPPSPSGDSTHPALDNPAPVETLADTIITAAKPVSTAIPNASNAILERIESWCDLHGLDASGTKTNDGLARQAVFNVFLKATLYEKSHQRGTLPALPASPRSGFQLAHNQTDVNVFQENMLDELAWLAPDESFDAVIAARHALLESSQPAEDLGNLYETILPTAIRQRLGQFRTPAWIGKLMRSWAASSTDRLLDPGLGAGVLSSPFHPRWSVCTDPDHVNGIDRSPLSRLMGTTALTLAGQSHEAHATDFLAFSPDDIQQPVDAIVANPPYSNGDSLPKEYKNQVNEQLQQATGLEISARSPLYAYFIYHARAFLSPGDRAVFLTPQRFLTTAFGEALRRFILDEFSIKALVRFPTDGESVFETAETTALLMFLEVTAPGQETGISRFIRVDEDVDASDLRTAVEKGDHGETDWGWINAVPQADLAPDEHWTAYFDPFDVDPANLTPLGDLVDIHRGKSTGNVDAFCLTQQTVDEYGIPEKHLSRLIRRPQLIDGFDFTEQDWERLRDTGEAVWLLDPAELSTVPDSVAEFENQSGVNTEQRGDGGVDEEANTIAYLQDAVADYDLAGTHALEARPYWYRPRRQDSPHVLVPDADRTGFSFNLNETTARNINNIRGIYNTTLGETELKAILAWLNSHTGQDLIQQYTQPQQGGYEKLGVSALKALPVIDPSEIAADTVSDLSELFDQLRVATRENQDCRQIQDRIDEILQRAL